MKIEITAFQYGGVQDNLFPFFSSFFISLWAFFSFITSNISHNSTSSSPFILFSLQFCSPFILFSIFFIYTDWVLGMSHSFPLIFFLPFISLFLFFLSSSSLPFTSLIVSPSLPLPFLSLFPLPSPSP